MAARGEAYITTLRADEMKPIASILASPCKAKYVANTATTKNPTSITPNSIAVLACIYHTWAINY